MGKLIFTFIYAALACLPLLANDTYLGSVGGNAFNEERYDNKFVSYRQSDSIEMVKEIVKITVFRDSFAAHCKFWFYNLGKKETVFFGFPNTTSSEAISTGNLRNFITLIKGKRDQATIATQVTDYEYESFVDSINWFRWAYEVPSRETLLVENYYTGEIGFIWNGACVSYIIGTGSTWKGPIKHGTITFDFSNVVSDFFIMKESNSTTKVTPRFYQDSVVFKFSNYKPIVGEILRVDYLSYWKNWNPFAPKLIFRDKEPSKDDYRLMRNEVYARHGYIFKDQKLQQYFSTKQWYKPDNNFSPESLNIREKAFIDYILQLENNAK